MCLPRGGRENIPYLTKGFDRRCILVRKIQFSRGTFTNEFVAYTVALLHLSFRRMNVKSQIVTYENIYKWDYNL